MKNVKKLLALALVASISMSSFSTMAASNSYIETYVEDEDRYYDSKLELYYLLDRELNLPTSSLGSTKDNLINYYQDVWVDKLYDSTSKEEADSILEEIKSEWAELRKNMEDQSFIDYYAGVFETREATAKEMGAIYNSYYESTEYTRDSREAYRDAVGAAGDYYRAMSYEEIEQIKTAETAAQALLVKVDQEILDCREAAIKELNDYNDLECEGLSRFKLINYDDDEDYPEWGNGSNYDYEDLINESLDADQINYYVEKGKAACLYWLDKNFNGILEDYARKKYQKASNYEDTFEEVLGDKFEEFIKMNRANGGISDYLVSKTTKKDVDEAYLEILDIMYANACELAGSQLDPDKPIEVTEVVLNAADITLNVEDTFKLEATVNPDNATDKTITWTSSDNTIATVDEEGLVTAIAEGEAIITATANNEVTGNCNVTVLGDSTNPGVIEVKSISLNKNELNLNINDSEKLIATVKPDNATDKTVVWTSSDDAIATVDENGLVTGISEGKAVIAATAGEYSVECEVTVIRPYKFFGYFGKTRYSTSTMIADAYKEMVYNNGNMDYIIIASGENFPDALSGSYLSKVVSAPILLVNDNTKDDIVKYVRGNLKVGGRVYVLGGTDAVSESVIDALANIPYSFGLYRLNGKDRYETNLEILKEAGISKEDPILICTGNGYADSLSASATGYPILLVGKKGFTEDQLAFINEHSENEYIIIGGTNAISEEIENSLPKGLNVDRISGSKRVETSVKIAERFFPNADTVSLVYSHGFADGLCGSALAYQMGAPLILAKTGLTTASDYVQGNDIRNCFVLSGTARISKDTVNEIFGTDAYNPPESTYRED